MKEALELAWSVAYLNGDGTNPFYLQIDDVSFLRPISVGSIVNFKGKNKCFCKLKSDSLCGVCEG